MLNSRELPACPVETTLLFISNKWVILIYRELGTGTKRFGELQKKLKSVSQKVLTANLRELETKGIINRKVYPVVPPKVEYSLTELGKTLDPIIQQMEIWGKKYKSSL